MPCAHLLLFIVFIPISLSLSLCLSISYFHRNSQSFSLYLVISLVWNAAYRRVLTGIRNFFGVNMLSSSAKLIIFWLYFEKWFPIDLSAHLVYLTRFSFSSIGSQSTNCWRLRWHGFILENEIFAEISINLMRKISSPRALIELILNHV